MSKEEKPQKNAQANNQDVVQAPKKAPVALEDSPGKQLQEGRNKLGLTQLQVAERLHLRLTSVEAVEQDELEEGVSVTFTKGYVRLYAKLVHLDAQPLLEAYDKLHATEREPAKLQSFSRRVSREAHDHRWNMVSVVVVLLVLGSIVFWWVDREGYFDDSGLKVTQAWDNLVGGEDESQPSAAPTDREQDLNSQDGLVKQNTGPEIPEEAVALLDDADSQANDIATGAGDIADNGIDDAEQAIEQAAGEEASPSNTDENTLDDISQTLDETSESLVNEVDDAAEQAPVMRNSADIVEGVFTDAGYRVNADGTVNVTFTFKNDCWVSVKDGNGDTMAYGVKKQGRIMEVAGVPPVRIILGAPKAVEIDFGGQRIDMSVYPGGESAKFTLPIESE